MIYGQHAALLHALWLNMNAFFFAQILGHSAWTANVSNYYQYLDIILKEQNYNISYIETRGLSGPKEEFVYEYVVQYSDDGDKYQTFSSLGGVPKVGHAQSISSIVCLQILIAIYHSWFYIKHEKCRSLLWTKNLNKKILR